MSKELKACPFCGADARVWSIDVGFWVSCSRPTCLISPETPLCNEKEQAAVMWNTRKGETNEND